MAALFAIMRAMSSRTDDRPRSEQQIEVASESEVVASPEATPAPESADDDQPTVDSFRAIFSANQRAGRWEAADEIHLLAIAGEVTLDFTRADLPPSGVVEIHALAIAGEVHIIVPEGAEIELEGEPFLGSIEQHVFKKKTSERIREWVTGEREEDLPPPPPTQEPPFFRVLGRAIMGTVKVTGR